MINSVSFESKHFTEMLRLMESFTKKCKNEHVMMLMAFNLHSWAMLEGSEYERELSFQMLSRLHLEDDVFSTLKTSKTH